MSKFDFNTEEPQQISTTDWFVRMTSLNTYEVYRKGYGSYTDIDDLTVENMFEYPELYFDFTEYGGEPTFSNETEACLIRYTYEAIIEMLLKDNKFLLKHKVKNYVS